MEPPRWATRLMLRMARDYRVAPPSLMWRTRRSVLSSGFCHINARAIGVSEGSDSQDARLAVLHEMGHLILLKTVPEYRGEHDDRFYDFFWPLIRRYRFPMKVALEYESSHHKHTVERTYRRGGGSLKVEV